MTDAQAYPVSVLNDEFDWQPPNPEFYKFECACTEYGLCAPHAALLHKQTEKMQADVRALCDELRTAMKERDEWQRKELITAHDNTLLYDDHKRLALRADRAQGQLRALTATLAQREAEHADEVIALKDIIRQYAEVRDRHAAEAWAAQAQVAALREALTWYAEITWRGMDVVAWSGRPDLKDTDDGGKVARDALAHAPQRAQAMLAVVSAARKKQRTWERLGKCEDEFGRPSAACGEYAEADDQAQIELNAALDANK